MSGRVTGRAMVIWGISWVAYIVVFSAIHQITGTDMLAVLILVPLFVGGYLFGRIGAAIGVVLMWPIQISLFLFADHEPGWDLVAGTGGLLGFVAIGIVALLGGVAFERVRTLSDLNVEKDRLVANVSHEVRNPLTGIVGLSSVLADAWDDIPPDEARSMVTMIAAEAQSLTTIVDDLLDVSRLRAGTITLEAAPVDIGPVVSGLAGPGVSVAGGAVAVADAARVAQIVRNLLVNAERHGAPPVSVSMEIEGDTVVVAVRDRGPGVDPELADEIFRPFATSGKPGSTGLGLSVSRQLARAMGGDLDYRRDGEETVFSLTLPARDGTHPPDAATASSGLG